MKENLECSDYMYCIYLDRDEGLRGALALEFTDLHKKCIEHILRNIRNNME